MLQSLNYRHLIAHFIPGLVMFVATILICDVISGFAISAYIKSNSNNLLTFLMVFFIGSITLGLLVDGIRYGLEYIIMHKSEKQKRNLYAGVNEKNFESFKYIYENSYPFYQFYSNMCVSLAVLAYALPWYFFKILNEKHKHIWWVFLLIILFAFIMHILAAKRSFKKHEDAIIHFFPSDEKRENLDELKEDGRKDTVIKETS